MKFFKILASGALALLFLVTPVWARDWPAPTGYVNDFGRLFSTAFRQSLETNLGDFEVETTAELAVVTIESLEEQTIEQAAVELFEQWKIGKKDQDNGLLILIAHQDRKMRIEVGYGLEPVITDGRAGRIIREQMSPAFKEDDFEGGVQAAVDKIQDYIISGTPPLEAEVPVKISVINPFLIFLFLFLLWPAAFWGRSKRIWPGGIVGAILGLIVGSLLGAFLLGFWGLFLDWLFSRNYKKLKKSGRSTGFWSSRGGFSGGGGGGGGGFGGGSSGGGGASGGW